MRTGALKAQYTSIDLFSGAGGLSKGLSVSGFKPLYANEIMTRYAETYALNHPDAIVESRDIRQVVARDVRCRLGLRKGELDLLAGGPPCQGFSINAPKRTVEDARNSLFLEFLRFVDEFEPKAVLIENVPGLVSFEGGGTLQAILQALRQHSYTAEVKILYAPHFGIPQTRWRTVIIGIRGDKVDPICAFPEPIHNAPLRVNFTSNFGGRNIVALPKKLELPSFVSVRDAIDDLPALLNGEVGSKRKEYRTEAQNDFQAAMRHGTNGVQNHEAPRLGEVNVKRMSFIPPGGNWTYIPEELLPKGMKLARRSDHTKRYGRVAPEGLASTILTKCDPHWGAYFHYNQDRCFTVREAARIQAFPDSFRFVGSRVEQYEQVGNAVPPLLAAAIGRSIRSVLDDLLGRVRKVS